MSRVGWLDCSAGVSGDMLLCAAVDAGADITAVVADLDRALGTRTSFTTVSRAGLRARALEVDTPTAPPPRRLPDLLAIVAGLSLPDRVRDTARRVLERLAAAEAGVHGVAPDDVHFHEIGAVDTVLDVVGVCAAVAALGLDRLVVSPVALGGGEAAGAHGTLPVPAPAVVALLRGSGLTGYGADPTAGELATPTGVALLTELADASGPLPGMRVESVGVGAGARDLPDRANAVRLVVGASTDGPAASDAGEWLLLEANVDDLDPRLWPGVLDALFAAGAADAWLTPILMKKGRPAHTIAALTRSTSSTAVQRALFRESSTIGVRSSTVGKRALDRHWVEVDVGGHRVRVKVATLDGEVVSATPEWDDVATAARALDRPAKSVLAAAIAAADTTRES